MSDLLEAIKGAFGSGEEIRFLSEVLRVSRGMVTRAGLVPPPISRRRCRAWAPRPPSCSLCWPMLCCSNTGRCARSITRSIQLRTRRRSRPALPTSGRSPTASCPPASPSGAWASWRARRGEWGLRQGSWAGHAALCAAASSCCPALLHARRLACRQSGGTPRRAPLLLRRLFLAGEIFRVGYLVGSYHQVRPRQGGAGCIPPAWRGLLMTPAHGGAPAGHGLHAPPGQPAQPAGWRDIRNHSLPGAWGRGLRVGRGIGGGQGLVRGGG